MIINVTSKHIKRGERNSANRCPVALALQDAGFIDPYCHSYGFLTQGKTGNQRYRKLPRSASRFIRRADLGKSLKSFNFRIK